jgi:drug/metabolite transporter (DMT)-like permease
MVAASSCFATMNAMTALLGRRGLPWQATVFARASIGLLFAIAVWRLRKTKWVVADRKTMWVRSLAGSSSMMLTFYALTHMPLADATALLNTTPLWIALFAYIHLGEKPGRSVIVALFVALAGVWFVEQPSFARGELAGLCALLAGMASAVAMVSLRQLGTEPPEIIVTHFSSIATVVTGSALGLRAAQAPVRAPHSWIELLLVLAVGATATMGQLVMTRAYGLDRAARVGGVGWVQVLLALLIDGLFRSKWPNRSAMTGICLLILAGILLYLSARAAEQRSARATSPAQATS